MMNSYKTIFLTIIFLISYQTGSTQNYLGAQIGFSRSQTSLYLTSDSEDIFVKRDILQRISFATAFEVEVNDLISVLIEPSLATEGTILEKRMTAGGSSFFTENAIKYLRLPLLFKLNLNLGNSQIYGVGGLSIGYALGGSTNTWTPFESIVIDKIDFEEESLDRLDYGAVLGMGIEKEIAKGVKISAGMRYNLGLNNIAQKEETEIYNQGIAVMMGMFYPLAKKIEK